MIFFHLLAKDFELKVTLLYTCTDELYCKNIYQSTSEEEMYIDPELVFGLSRPRKNNLTVTKLRSGHVRIVSILSLLKKICSGKTHFYI